GAPGGDRERAGDEPLDPGPRRARTDRRRPHQSRRRRIHGALRPGELLQPRRASRRGRVRARAGNTECRRRLRRDGNVIRAVAALAASAAVLVWETWPLAAKATTHFANTGTICRTDIPYITWILAWQSHALATAPATVLDTNIYWPARRTLFYGDPG